MRVVTLHFVVPESVAKDWERKKLVPFQDLPDFRVGKKGTMRCVAGELTRLTLDTAEVADLRRGMEGKESKLRIHSVGIGVGRK